MSFGATGSIQSGENGSTRHVSATSSPFSAANGGILRTGLQDGGIKLSRSIKRTQYAAPREPGRIITMAWGERYIHDMLSVTIPALLAPGNIPAFSEHFDCEFVIVTELRLFELIANSPVADRLLDYCDIRLVPIDDLLSSWYGITLTYALVRGFADLGPEMVNTHLVFLNADFITADGSYRKLAEMIRGGERLVVSPSYCMVLEGTIEALRDRYDPVTCSLSVPPREMARMILDHRHNTIRAKTVNQQLFRIHRYDQFYWYVDEHTMLARQMPIAVVYMRPEHALTEMPTFWDYGVISEYCPTTKPCVLGDSDDFLMGELRTKGTFRELLHLGWPSVDEIAEDLSSFTVKDHHDYGRHTLVLHSADLPATVERDKKQLGEFVDEVYSRLRAPISYRNHPFWAAAFPHFRAAHEARRAELRQQSPTDRRDSPEYAVSRQRVDVLSSRLSETREELLALHAGTGTSHQQLRAKLFQLEASYRNDRQLLEAELRHVDLRRQALLETARQLETEISDLLAPRKKPAAPGAGDRQKAARLSFGGVIGALTELYRLAFGQVPDTRPWHAYHAVFAQAKRLLAEGEDRECRNALVIASANDHAALLAKCIAAKKVTITPEMAQTGLYEELFKTEDRFDICLCAFAFEDMHRFRAILDRVRPHLRDGSRVILFHINSALRSLDESTFEFTETVFPLVGQSRIAFTGSRPAAWALRLFNRGLALGASTAGRIASMMLLLGLSAPLSRFAAWEEKGRRPTAFPRHCTSLTIEIRL